MSMRISMQFFGGRGIPTMYIGHSDVTRGMIIRQAENNGYERVDDRNFVGSASAPTNENLIGEKFVISHDESPATFARGITLGGAENTRFLNATYEGDGQFRTSDNAIIDLRNEGPHTIVFRKKRR